jgi:hypothetical protein
VADVSFEVVDGEVQAAEAAGLLGGIPEALLEGFGGGVFF